MNNAYVKQGVRMKHQRAPRSKWSTIRQTEPKVHRLIYDSLNRYYYRECDNIMEPYGVEVPRTVVVTCKRCLARR